MLPDVISHRTLVVRFVRQVRVQCRQRRAQRAGQHHFAVRRAVEQSVPAEVLAVVGVDRLPAEPSRQSAVVCWTRVSSVQGEGLKAGNCRPGPTGCQPALVGPPVRDGDAEPRGPHRCRGRPPSGRLHRGRRHRLPAPETRHAAERHAAIARANGA